MFRHKVGAKRIPRIMSSSFFAVTPTLTLKFLPGEKPVSRFGVIVSKKFDKRATKRNYAKRRIFAEIQQHLPYLPVIDALVMFRKGIKYTEGQATYALEIKDLLEKTRNVYNTYCNTTHETAPKRH